MPAIQFLETVPAPSGSNTPATGAIMFTPTRAFTGPGAGEEVLPRPFQVQLDATGGAVANLAPTGGSWCWRVDQYITGVPPVTTYVAVSPTDSRWPSLVRVDPATLTAVATTPAWVAMANSTVTSGTVNSAGHLILTRTDATTIDTGSVQPVASDTVQSVSGTVALAVAHESSFELNATSAATVTLTAALGTQCLIAWSGANSTLCGVIVSAGNVYVAINFAGGWKVFQASPALVVPPAAPSPSITGVTSSTATAQWAAVPSATGYKTRVNGATVTDVGNVLTFTATGLSASTSGTIEVQAYNSGGSSAWASVGFTTSAAPLSVIRFTISDPSVVETGNGTTGWIYTGTNVPTGQGAYATVGATNDFVFQFSPNNMSAAGGLGGNVATFGINTSTGASTGPQYAITTSYVAAPQSGGAAGVYYGYQKSGSGSVNPGNSPNTTLPYVLVATSDVCQMKRAGTVVTLSVSNDGGTTFTQITSWPTETVVKLYPEFAGWTVNCGISTPKGSGFA